MMFAEARPIGSPHLFVTVTPSVFGCVAQCGTWSGCRGNLDLEHEHRFELGVLITIAARIKNNAGVADLVIAALMGMSMKSQGRTASLDHIT